ncbi:hypothetical protein ATK36_1374 [Amycolatopsis sulphurea]|uniref:Uncharacterized protein n=1 Tax=Amycolatopsis sulphurea TaxID=76022 RepID=A0A2A9F7D2_9PSEU|nr:hypothetical protein ATK36_1374 [Amycolatopsis sulphurea]
MGLPWSDDLGIESQFSAGRAGGPGKLCHRVVTVRIHGALKRIGRLTRE